ncbi:MAG TPA: hypothetical protein VKA68_04970 [bacterium]|nr:hypothetical protein [bacterium]
MKSKHRILLALDGVVNVILGIALLLFPAGLLDLLGAPETSTYFYPGILGAVIFGIGVALFMELLSESKAIRGLGLGGAIVINLCGGGALLGWLLFGSLALPLRGYIILWSVAIIVLGLGGVELATKSWSYNV